MMHKVTIELDNRDFELLRSLCKQQGLSPQVVISFALWNRAEKFGTYQDEFLSRLYGEPIYHVEQFEKVGDQMVEERDAQPVESAV